MDTTKVIRDLTRTQFGVVARRQLRELDIDRKKIQRQVAAGDLELVTERVLRLVGTPPSKEQELMIPLLHVGFGSVLSHATAAAWWGIAGFRLDKIHVSLERNRHWVEDMGSITVHHVTKIPEWCRKELGGIPVVSPGLAIYQLAGSMHEDRVGRALDNAWSLRLVDGATIDRLLYEMGRPGRDGTKLMRKLRAVRADDWVPPASNLEHRFDQIMNKAGVMSLRRQVDLGGEEWSGRVDFLDCECPLVIEILSERYHTALTDRQADADRRQRLQAIGLTVVEVWDHEIFLTPSIVVQRVLAARRSLMAAA